MEVMTVPILGESSFYQFVREERFFCSILAHLLMQEGPNLQSFLELVREKTGARPLAKAADIRHAEIYLEFSFLRDHWHSLGRDNDAKRRLITTSLIRVPELQQFDVGEFPQGISDFNAFFIGSRGHKIKQDISFPAQWSVATLAKRFGHRPEQFRGFCKFKWSFNIKPDIVVLVPGSKPLCIEAKLESTEGQYPTNSSERKIFDEIFGIEEGRVGQLKLQQFMFEKLLEDPCDSLFLSRNPGPGAHVTWHEVFERLDVNASIPFVRSLIEENRHIRRR